MQQPPPNNKKENLSADFVDPVRKPWVGGVLLALLFMLLPVWPVEGNWWGIPAWSALALLASFLTSAFIAFVILCIWKDPDELTEEKTHD